MSYCSKLCPLKLLLFIRLLLIFFSTICVLNFSILRTRQIEWRVLVLNHSGTFGIVFKNLFCVLCSLYLCVKAQLFQTGEVHVVLGLVMIVYNRILLPRLNLDFLSRNVYKLRNTFYILQRYFRYVI